VTLPQFVLFSICLSFSSVTFIVALRSSPTFCCGVHGYTRGADKSRPTSRFILFDGENISLDASLVT